MAKKYDAGVKEYRDTYFTPDYVPLDTDLLACFKCTGQEGVPKEEVAAAVAADVPPTPPKLRGIIADPNCSVESKAAAKVELRRHQKNVQKIVARAEKKQASVAMHLENGPDVSSLVAEFKQRGEPFTWAEFARELRTRYYPNYGPADGDFSTWTNPTHAERLCVASAAYQRTKSGD